MTNKASGRVGDSAIIGAGTYADNATCAVSCTGVGEIFIREAVGHEIAARIRLGGQTLALAAAEVVQDVLAARGGFGGLIAIGADASLCMEFNCASMFRAWRSGDALPQAAIFQDI